MVNWIRVVRSFPIIHGWRMLHHDDRSIWSTLHHHRCQPYGSSPHSWPPLPSSWTNPFQLQCIHSTMSTRCVETRGDPNYEWWWWWYYYYNIILESYSWQTKNDHWHDTSADHSWWDIMLGWWVRMVAIHRPWIKKTTKHVGQEPAEDAAHLAWYLVLVKCRSLLMQLKDGEARVCWKAPVFPF